MKNSHLKNALISGAVAVFFGVVLLGTNAVFGAPTYAPPGAGVGPTFTGLTVGGTIGIGAGSEIFFADNGQIRSKDDNHAIVFDRVNNKFVIREYGDINFFSGYRSGDTAPAVSFPATAGGDEIKLVDSGPQIQFEDTNGDDYWLHVNDGRFYILWDEGDDGDWDSPYPVYFQGRNANFGGDASFGGHVDAGSIGNFYQTWSSEITIPKSGVGTVQVDCPTGVAVSCNWWTTFTGTVISGGVFKHDVPPFGSPETCKGHAKNMSGAPITNAFKVGAVCFDSGA
ncbi:MAG: hypothetical protein V1679_02625 [Candidatus Peregrinibacteria bacterium]